MKTPKQELLNRAEKYNRDNFNKQLAQGGYAIAGSKIYSICATCKGLVRVNKFILGDLHICV